MSVVRDKSCRFSLSNQSGSPQLSPQSQITTGSNSEAQLDDLKLPHGYNSPGMKDVQAWLKSLRLHKYSKLFSQLTYEQMLSLSEETFDSVLQQIDAGPVTQGARRKVIRSIAKLRELCQLEQDVTNGGNLLNAMDMLKAVLVTPIKPATSDDDTSSSSGGNRQQTALDDIPAQFTKVLGKVCMQLIASDRADEEALSCFISILDKTYHHDCFTSQQKRKVSSWRLQFKQQLRQMRPDPLRYLPQNVFLQPSLPIRATIPGSRFPQCVVSPTGPCPRQVQFHRNASSSLTTSTGNNSGISITAGSTGTNASGISTHHVQHGPVVANVSSSVVGSGISSNNAASVFHAKRPSLQDHHLLE
ncbi:protein Smaug homolog 2-like, partial [Lycorma delicatula]|uniref:protein Smaug homolog 2-like n=1 Tax=Lycorma delicatula TaxID=130591 RepID=UPI003F514698